MDRKARTPIGEYEDYLAIELPGEHPPDERDRLTDQAMVVAYDRVPRARLRWRLRGLYFDRDEWTRSGIRRWWAAHEVHLLAEQELDRPIPELCRSYPAPGPTLPNIVICHRNTALVPARQQMNSGSGRGASHGKARG
jgi:hypothetical protein